MSNPLVWLLLLVSIKSYGTVKVIYQNVNPIWGITKLNKNHLLFTEKKGNVYKFNLKTKKKQKLKINFPGLIVAGQGGLLDIYYYKEKIYLTYSYKSKLGNTTRLASAELNSILENAQPANFKVLYTARAYESTTHHYGSRLLIKDNHIYMTIGDRGKRDKAQSLKSDHGKVLRLNLDGTIPSDNPYKNAIYTLGHRNPQGITYLKDAVYTGEFGPRGGDEINLIKAKNNYGWPIITFGEEYSGGKIKTNLSKEKHTIYTPPLKYWNPSLSFSEILIAQTKKETSLYLACLGTTQIVRLNLKGKKISNQSNVSKNLSERYRALEFINKKVYFATDNGSIGFIL